VRGTVELARERQRGPSARGAPSPSPNVVKHLDGRTLAKFIYKPGRIVGLGHQGELGNRRRTRREVRLEERGPVGDGRGGSSTATK
jgi:hypothetical protein